VLTCLRAVGYLGGACVRVVVSVVAGALVGLVLGPLAVTAALHYVDGTGLGSDLPCCPSQVSTADYLSTLQEAAHQLEALPARLSELT
jgi:hypothetical protein